MNKSYNILILKESKERIYYPQSYSFDLKYYFKYIVYENKCWKYYIRK